MKRPCGIRGLVKTFFRKRGIVYVVQRHSLNHDIDLFFGRAGLNALVPEAESNACIAITGIARVGMNRRKLKKALPLLLCVGPSRMAGA